MITICTALVHWYKTDLCLYYYYYWYYY